jgi:hypothetical protein
MPRMPTARLAKPTSSWKGITGRPADGLRDRVRNEEVTEESTNSASRNTDPKQIQQKDFQPPLAGPTSPVQTEMTGSNDDRQDGEAEHTDRNNVHASPPRRTLSPSSVGVGPPLLLVADDHPTRDSQLRVRGPRAPAHHAELDMISRRSCERPGIKARRPHTSLLVPSAASQRHRMISETQDIIEILRATSEKGANARAQPSGRRGRAIGHDPCTEDYSDG